MNPTDPTGDVPQEAPSDGTEGSAAYVPTGADYVSDRDFADFPISPEVLKAIHEMGYKTATPVQAQSIEPAIAGRDMLVRAKTGTGKTVAFCVPILERIPDGERVPRAVILAPTRELAQQIYDEMTLLAKYRDLTVAILVGGMPMGAQERALSDGAAIVVGTPGRVLDHMGRKNLDLSGSLVGCLDEADEMLSMGFYEDVTAILDALPKTAQILLFSATIGADTQRIIARYLKDPEQITLSTDADQVEGIEHVIYETPIGQPKHRSLLNLIDLEDPASAIIFCNTREDAASVASFLDRQGLDVQLLSGELPQTRRNKVMKQVKAGLVRFLVATDVAARGIDISDLSHVIQYSLPQDPAIYLHRTGRTGRIGKKGTALSLVGASELQTKRVLEGQHKIKFVPKAFPTPEEAIKRRVDRQSKQIRDAMGSMVFEAYLPTARELMTRPDGEQLVAAALRAFFQWDRTRRAAMLTPEVDENGEPIEGAVPEERSFVRPRKETSGRPERRDRDGDRKKDRRDRPERGDRDRKRGDRDDRKARGDKRDERRPAPAAHVASVDDFDALLVEAIDDSTPATAAEAVAPQPGAADLAPSDEAGKKKKRRRRRKKKGADGAEGVEAADGSDADGSDEGEGEGEAEAEPVVKPAAKKSADLDDLLVEADDLDAFLDME